MPLAFNFEQVNTPLFAENDLELTWTSRWQSTPLVVMNNTELVGDHVGLNATFPESLNVTKCAMTIESGFRLNTTRELVIPSDAAGQFTGIINHTEFDWVIVKGIEKELLVNIAANFTNADCDFMAWSGDQEYSQFSYSNNFFGGQMATGSKPETAEKYWESDNDTMYIGCLNYDRTPGNWTLYLQVGIYKSIVAADNGVFYDTYTLDRSNQTVNIRIEGTTELNETLIYSYEDVTLSNFFKPDVIVNHPVEVENDLFNVTWTCTDKNANDTNFFSVWLSFDGGVSYQLLARNLTQTYYLWNAAGFLERDNYIFRIRAFSVDLTTGLASVDDEANYWPGDYSDGFSSDFAHNGPFYVPAYLVDVDSPPDITYYIGVIGNLITWTLDVQLIYHGFLISTSPANFHYEVLRNNEVILSSYWDGGNSIVINVDHLDVGVHNYTLACWNPAENTIVIDTVFVTVRELPLIPTLIIIGGSVGIGVGFLVLFFLKKRVSPND